MYTTTTTALTKTATPPLFKKKLTPPPPRKKIKQKQTVFVAISNNKLNEDWPAIASMDERIGNFIYTLLI